MRIEVLAKASQDILRDEDVRNKAAEGKFEDIPLSLEEKQALTALARRIKSGEGLPKHALRSRGLLGWLSQADI